MVSILLLFAYSAYNSQPTPDELVLNANKYFDNKEYENAERNYNLAIKYGYDPHKIADKYFSLGYI